MCWNVQVKHSKELVRSFFMSQNTYNYMSEMLSVLCRAAAERMILGPCQCSVENKHWTSLDKKTKQKSQGFLSCLQKVITWRKGEDIGMK